MWAQLRGVEHYHSQVMLSFLQVLAADGPRLTETTPASARAPEHYLEKVTASIPQVLATDGPRGTETASRALEHYLEEVRAYPTIFVDQGPPHSERPPIERRLR